MIVPHPMHAVVVAVLGTMGSISSAFAAQGFPELTISAIEPVEDAAAIPLYKDSPTAGARERWNRLFGDQRVVRNVVQPTLTPVLPKANRATGAAVIVIPGGGFKFVSMDNEGWPIARWLAARGIAAFVLKYRVNETSADDQAFLAELTQQFAAGGRRDAPLERRLREPRATEDALAALRMVRENAAQWRVDPTRVGLIGFSAGAMTSLNVVLDGPPSDWPAFIGYIYGPMGSVSVPANAPPMFAALALDDALFAGQSFGIIDAWQRAGRAVEFHGYEAGNHGFGMGKAGTTSTQLMPQFHAWLEARGQLMSATRGR